MQLAEFISENYKDNEYIAKMNIQANRYNVSTYHYQSANLAIAPDEIDTYISMNPMMWKDKKIRRDKQHVSALRWLYVDLDIYRSDYSELTKEQILWNLEEDYFGIKMPQPTYVIDSGRGMYLLWRIDEHRLAYPRWVKVQNYLTNALLEYGADTSVVSDSSRVLRAVGSINSKSNTRVNILRKYAMRVYTLYDIMTQYMDYSSISNNSKKKLTENSHNSKIIFLNTPYTLLNSRLIDLERLLVMHRDYDNSHRECILFLYRYWTLCISDDMALALNKTIELNNRIIHKLPIKEVIKATKSAEKYYKNNKSLKFTNTKLIDFLAISENEMKDLRTIISNKEKSNRKKDRNRKNYLRKLRCSGKNTKEVEIKKRRIKEIKYINEGKKVQEICLLLNISKSTFYEDKKFLSSLSENEINEIIISEKIIEISKENNIEDANKINSYIIPENSAYVLSVRSTIISNISRIGNRHCSFRGRGLHIRSG
jgi:hypothetical protein